MAERPEDLNLPNAVITRIIKEAVGAGPAAQRSGAPGHPALGGPGLLRPRPRDILAPGGPWPSCVPARGALLWAVPARYRGCSTRSSVPRDATPLQLPQWHCRKQAPQNLSTQVHVYIKIRSNSQWLI